MTRFCVPKFCTEMRLTKISAVVVMCNNRTIKAILNPMDSGDLPYDMFQWDTIEDSPWGVGIPYLMRYAQRSLNAAWRQMQDNAGVSHGPQIVINRRLIEPHNGSWEISGMKLWQVKADSAVEDVSRALQRFLCSTHDGGFIVAANSEKALRLDIVIHELRAT